MTVEDTAAGAGAAGAGEPTGADAGAGVAEPAISEAAFFGQLRAFLAEHRPDLPGDDIEPSTQLWDAGYLDSFALIETISLLEEILGRPIEISADDLPSFFTMKDMYLAFVAP